MAVVSINTGAGDNQFMDFTSGFLGSANDEIARVCDELRDHPDLKHAAGLNMVGFSQGGQFARAVVQRCRCSTFVRVSKGIRLLQRFVLCVRGLLWFGTDI